MFFGLYKKKTELASPSFSRIEHFSGYITAHHPLSLLLDLPASLSVNVCAGFSAALFMSFIVTLSAYFKEKEPRKSLIKPPSKFSAPGRYLGVNTSLAVRLNMFAYIA